MRSDEAARLLGIQPDDTAEMVRSYLGSPDEVVTDGDDLMSVAAARKEWARQFEQSLNSQDEPLPEHEPSATPEDIAQQEREAEEAARQARYDEHVRRLDDLKYRGVMGGAIALNNDPALMRRALGN
ncbi:hypothetical protein C5E51_28085 [Nocardia nova]|uniref:hypothetical protein n=1 Tax=Nocardia nova TaxID=37330 RepID=UPI000CE9E572|nr:hypothetical protein [Nocardia nova]PPJ03333.1 hypothetical protein C5E51_28085 [Nocardia nova]